MMTKITVYIPMEYTLSFPTKIGQFKNDVLFFTLKNYLITLCRDSISCCKTYLCQPLPNALL
jgi:hypothetical protein